MTRLFLHIGSPKAGSSAIQAAFQAYDNAAQSSACVQPLPGNPYGKTFPSGFVAARYLNADELPRYLRLQHQRDSSRFYNDVEEYWCLIRDLVSPPARPHRWPWQVMPSEGRSRTVLLSSEYLWRIQVEQVRALRQDFESLGVTEFRVIAYVREPVSAYASFLQQWLRLSTDLERYNPFSWHYRPRLHLEAWDSVFGDALIVRPFVRDQLQGQSVVHDCFAQLSSWLDCKVSAVDVGGINSGLSVEELFLIHDLLQDLPADRLLRDPQLVSRLARFRRSLSNAAQRLECQPVRLQSWVTSLVWRRHQDDLEWLQQRYGIAFPPPDDLSVEAAFPDGQMTGFRLDQLLCPPEDPGRRQALLRQQLIGIISDGL